MTKRKDEVEIDCSDILITRQEVNALFDRIVERLTNLELNIKWIEEKFMTAPQTNEDLREKIKEMFHKYTDNCSCGLGIGIPDRCYDFLENEIAHLISSPQPEQAKEIIQGDFEESCPHCKKAIYVLPRRVKQIEVEIVQNQIVGARTILYKIVCVGNFNIDFLDKFYSKQEALDFCKRHNLKLKVVNEEKE